MEIPEQLALLSRNLRQLFQQQELSSAKLRLLKRIKEHNPATVKTLAELEKIAIPTLSKLLDELQRRQLIIRAISKEDARQRLIVPTQKGINQLAQAKKNEAVFWESKLSGLSQKEKEQVQKSLALLLQSFEE